MKYIPLALLLFLGVLCGACSSDSHKRLPSRQTDGGDLPWARPSDWEGGLPGMNNNSGRRF